MSLDPNLVQAANSQLVPASFAEKAMASLMQLHEDLCAEKEKRVELYRQLMEKEQALAELAMYVRLLEERLEGESAASTSPAGREADARRASESEARRTASGAASPHRTSPSASHSPADAHAGSIAATSAHADDALTSAARANEASAPAAGAFTDAAASASAVALAAELPASVLESGVAQHEPPKPPEVVSGPVRKMPVRVKPDDWKVW